MRMLTLISTMIQTLIIISLLLMECIWKTRALQALMMTCFMIWTLNLLRVQLIQDRQGSAMPDSWWMVLT